MLVVGSFLALILGVLVGMPILRPSMQTVPLGEQPRVYADVVYAYFSLLPINQSVSGLQHEQLVAFLFVLNVTNLSNEFVEITGVDAIAAGKITFAPATGGIFNATVPPNVEWSNVTQVMYVSTYEGAIGYGSSDIIATRSESFEGSDYQWPENASRLVALSGTVDVSESGLTAMQDAKIFVFSHVEGKGYSSGFLASGAYVIKGVQLETVGEREFVFNELLKADETLQVQHDGTGVTIVSGK
jgi:hypothetical protein